MCGTLTATRTLQQVLKKQFTYPLLLVLLYLLAVFGNTIVRTIETANQTITEIQVSGELNNIINSSIH